MTVRRNKKVRKLRGSKTHGWGAMKKHRGKGHRGGKGMSGTGKRGDQKKPSIWKKLNYFGKKGFAGKKKPFINSINIESLELNASKYILNNLATKEGDMIVIDVSKLGYNKVLGSGSLKTKMKIISPSFSEGAKEKIQQAGGQVVEQK
ncbi:MAG: uL15 family ribosomal protein [Candidatus Woesearchaeota archaeon]